VRLRKNTLSRLVIVKVQILVISRILRANVMLFRSCHKPLALTPSEYSSEKDIECQSGLDGVQPTS
jgi:hypothetical protein